MILRIRVELRFGDGSDIANSEDIWVRSSEEGRVDVDAL